MRIGIALTAAIVASGACSSRHEAPPPYLGIVPGTTHVAPAGTGSPDTIPPAVEPSLPARQLAADVATIHTRLDPEHADLVRALEHLADALAILVPDAVADRDEIRRDAAQLAASDRASLRHADLTKHALEAAVRILVTLVPMHPTHSRAYQEAIAAFGHAVETIEPGVPLLQQHVRVARAFDAATRSVYAVYGVTPPLRDGAEAVAGSD